MKKTLGFILSLAALPSTHSAFAGVIAKWYPNDIGYEGNTGIYVTEPPVWAHDPTVTVSKYTMHGSVGAGNGNEMSYQGWGLTLDPNNYVGFTVTPNPGDQLVLTSLNSFFNPYQNQEGVTYNWGYRINEGSGYGPWVFASPLESINIAQQVWNFPTPIVTTGAVEFGFFAAAPSTTTSVATGGPILNGTAGDTTPDPSLQGVVSGYTNCTTFRLDSGEASAIAYNWDTDTLFSVDDEGAEIIEFNKTGVTQSRMRMTQLKFPSTYKGDPEGLSYFGKDALGNGTFVIGAERENVAIMLKYYPNSYDDPDWMRTTPTVVFGPTNGNVGLEGVSYDAADGSAWGIKERQPISLLHATNLGTPGQTLVKIDVNDINWRLGLTGLSDIYVMANSAAYSGSDHILLVARDQNKLVEITKTGKVVDTLNIANIGRNTIEGVTMDDDGVIYLCSEGGSSADPRMIGAGLHVLTRPKTPVAGNGGRQTITGTAQKDEIYGNPASDVLSGGAEADTFVFKSLRDGIDTISDFTPGQDTLDLTEVLASVGYKGTTYNFQPLVDGGIRVIDSPGGALVQIKSSGSYRSLVILSGLTAAQVGVPVNFRCISKKLTN